MQNALKNYEEENRSLLHSSEEAKIENDQLKKELEILENKIHSHKETREEKVISQMSLIKELEVEISNKDNVIRDLMNKKQEADKKWEEECNFLRDELDIAKEKIM